jgi:alkylated DNA repair dioxygenase AlkB
MINIVDDTFFINFCDELADITVNNIISEIKFEEMFSQSYPVPRLIAIQGKIENGLEPIYRHPADAQPKLTPFSPFTQRICDYLSKKLNQNFNHVLIQLYRDGNDNIGEHADKTLDIQKNTSIVNYSVGATRTMKLRTKKIEGESEREIIRVKLTNNSIFVLGWNTNRNWLHSITQDKRLESEKSEDELFANGIRISFTFRNIATFIDSAGNIIGQGSQKFKTTNTNDLSLLHAFSRENFETNFDWEKYYG